MKKIATLLRPILFFTSLFSFVAAGQVMAGNTVRIALRTDPLTMNIAEFKGSTEAIVFNCLHQGILKAVKDHLDYKPAVDRIIFITVTDDVTRLAMLETGELDLITDIAPHQAKRLDRNNELTVKRTSRFPSLYNLGIKPYNYPVMQDINLRKAINHAVNQEEMAEKCSWEKDTPCTCFPPPPAWEMTLLIVWNSTRRNQGNS